MLEHVKQQALKIVLSVLAYVVLLAAGGYFLLPFETAGVLLWMLLAVLGLILLVRWHAGAVGYRCPNCGKETRYSLFRELFLSNKEKKIGGKAECPACGNRNSSGDP